MVDFESKMAATANEQWSFCRILQRMVFTSPGDLRCELSANPIGIGTPSPRFSWRMREPHTGGKQTAYCIVVSRSQELLTNGEFDLWSSGRIESGQSTNIVYQGAALTSRQRCYWQVRVWNEHEQVTAWSEIAWFEIGLLQPSDWIATWIGQPGAPSGEAKYFRCDFHLSEQPSRARLYISGLGYYKASLNGRALDKVELEPAYTNTSEQIHYVTHDVTHNLTAGANTLGAIVGSGWHGAPIFLAQLEVTYADGSRAVVPTGRDATLPPWSVAAGPIKANSVFGGECYDARDERPGWDRPGFDQNSFRHREIQWMPIAAVQPPSGRLVARPLEPIGIVRELKPMQRTEPKPGVFVFDFGQNHSGWVRLTIKGPGGTRVCLKYAELLNSDGTVNQANLRTALATDYYILRGDSVESWSPRFTYHGYRYVEVEGWPGVPTIESLTSCAIRSEIERRGAFSCDNETLNQVHRLVVATEESNLPGLPTDCPQRDERMGWLNDLATRAETLVYNYDSVRFLEKFMDDIADSQDALGAISDTAPFQFGHRPGDPVSLCYLLIPMLLRQHFGNSQVLEKHYDGMRRWVNFLTSEANNGIIERSHYGDWAPPASEAIAGSMGTGALSAQTPGSLISTACYFYSIDLLAKIARLLGRAQDERHYSTLAEAVGIAFHRKFWRSIAVGYGSGNQACNSIALHFGLVPVELRSAVATALAADVVKHDYHLTTGNLCTKYLLEVLSAEGAFDAALKIATQTTYPSWGFMLANGATTLWERWELLTDGGMNSHNHPMLGSVDAWLYRWVAGLTMAESRNGSPRFIYRPPLPGPTLSRAQATLSTPWGEAAITWTRTGNAVQVDIKVPWNSTGTVVLPNADSVEVASGDHFFSYPLPLSL